MRTALTSRAIAAPPRGAEPAPTDEGKAGTTPARRRRAASRRRRPRSSSRPIEDSARARAAPRLAREMALSPAALSPSSPRRSRAIARTPSWTHIRRRPHRIRVHVPGAAARDRAPGRWRRSRRGEFGVIGMLGAPLRPSPPLRRPARCSTSSCAPRATFVPGRVHIPRGLRVAEQGAGAGAPAPDFARRRSNDGARKCCLLKFAPKLPHGARRERRDPQASVRDAVTTRKVLPRIPVVQNERYARRRAWRELAQGPADRVPVRAERGRGAVDTRTPPPCTRTETTDHRRGADV